MSWDGYIDNLMAEPTPVAEAAIYGFAEGSESLWASTPGLKNITKEEIKRFISEKEALQTSGACLAGKKCRLIRNQMEFEGVYCCDLKTAAAADGSTVSVCVGKTNKAFVIAFAKKDVSGGTLGDRVYKMVSYLRGLGY
ncbi:profilin-1 [Halichoeres trimaculatus]|uniref:profilin-1 n=1 Tax=Halichoeres trimaculatus TaxID=147232 RepID=UPI003D9DFCDE